ncbi:hypothetical protein IMCC20628_00897 [Hoeflea sp. IMCC20628]|uniref:GFA family protein n=1 Tax=Hoeflea sp. IMCC20628 TaxID=1620421 RepID=UPI00063B07F0|nr:GFA family protein [Hoeflea sp. IMCC20628]AKH99616.1 hypothetical protein IMCC20628_00897 [Hoeflea sp. IMCC20628]
MTHAEGGCLCGRVRYAVNAQPSRLTICHCKFCQRATGSAYLVEPVFEDANFSVTKGEVKIYDHRSEGSGKLVHVHFCENCGTKLYLRFERFAGAVGIYGGTFDDPNWFDRPADTSKQIFLSVAQTGTVIPAGVNCFQEHATTADGIAIEPTVFAEPHVIKAR